MLEMLKMLIFSGNIYKRYCLEDGIYTVVMLEKVSIFSRIVPSVVYVWLVLLLLYIIIAISDAEILAFLAQVSIK